MKKGQKKKHWAKFRFEIVKNPKARQKYHWRAVACNGKIVCSSETMYASVAPLKTIKSFIKGIQEGKFKIVDKVQNV